MFVFNDSTNEHATVKYVVMIYTVLLLVEN